MTFLKKTCIGVLILSFVGLHVPNITLAASHYLAQGETVTKHAPEVLATAEEKIPVEEIVIETSRTWLWVLGGALLLGIIAAAGGGGGGGGDGGSTSGDNTGDVTVHW